MRSSHAWLIFIAALGLAFLVTTVIQTETGYLVPSPPLPQRVHRPPSPLAAPPAPITTPGPPSSWEQFYAFLEEIQPCKKLLKVGGPSGSSSDGSKSLCLDAGFELQPGACTVLSFGINNEWSFDDAMERRGCTVYAFDPSMDVKDHTRGHNIHFYQLGVSNIRKRVMFNTLQGQLDTYSAILRKINATERVIDFLKMDVEGAEIQFFEDVLAHNVSLLANVKQIGMEIHPNVDINRRDQLWRYMHHLAALNFQLVSMEPNRWSLIGGRTGRQTSNSYELAWVNRKFRL
ncbi:uncharacterized protein LOC108669175 [Hyalella azteca]|uniref:Uncharacterized protein LOC108669175 n=1 Tax=Hyalella azteca TaxID=294128 RepID=A0A8B7NEC0_HYAAZ|nr:uncharacterized protein LOC108669175 [Hyalella azteca]